MRHGYRAIEGMLGSDLPEDTRLGVEEAEGLLQVDLL